MDEVLTVDPYAVLGSGVQTKWSLAGRGPAFCATVSRAERRAEGCACVKPSSVPGAVAGSYNPGSYPDLLRMVLGKFPPLSEPQLTQV